VIVPLKFFILIPTVKRFENWSTFDEVIRRIHIDPLLNVNVYRNVGLKIPGCYGNLYTRL